MGNLNGKVALITGAGGMKGIGRATALKLASQGADIVLSDVKRAPSDLPPQEVQAQWRSIDSVAQEVKMLGRRCHTIWCDLTVSAEIEAMVSDATSRFGHLDILVNNARAIIGRDRVPITELSEDVWQRFFAINTTAVFLATKFAGQTMIRQARRAHYQHRLGCIQTRQSEYRGVYLIEVRGGWFNASLCARSRAPPHYRECRVPGHGQHGPTELLGAGTGTRTGYRAG